MSMSEVDLAAAEALMNAEFNGGLVEAPEIPDVEPAAAPAEPDTPELTIDAQGRVHGPDGKFVAQSSEEPEATEGTSDEAEEAPEAVAETDSEGQSEGTPDEPVVEEDVIELDAETLGIDEDHPLFTKYGGDLPKALEALAESQRLVGERAHEVGDLRKENETLQQLVEELRSLQARVLPYQNDVDEAPQELAHEIVQRAMDTGDVSVLDDPRFATAIRNWGEEDPFAAAQFAAQVNIARTMALQAVSAQEPADDTAALAAEVDAFKRNHPDLDQVLPVMTQLAEQRPVMQRALYEGTAQERAQALEDLYALAKSRSNETVTSEAAKRVILRAKALADKDKSDAAVIGASRTSAVTSEAPSGDRLLEQALREMSGLDDLVIEG